MCEVVAYMTWYLKEIPYERQQERKRSWWKNWKNVRKNKKKTRTLAIFYWERRMFFFFFNFLPFVKSISSIWLVIAPELLHEMLWFFFDFSCIKPMFFQSVFENPVKICRFLCKNWVGTLYHFFLKSNVAFWTNCVCFLRVFSNKLSYKTPVNSCFWIIFFRKVRFQCRNFLKFYFFIS